MTELTLGLTIGLAIAFFLWRATLKENRREEEAYQLYVEFYAHANRGNVPEADNAWTRYVEFFEKHGLNRGAFHAKFESRLEQTLRDARSIGNPRK